MKLARKIFAIGAIVRQLWNRIGDWEAGDWYSPSRGRVGSWYGGIASPNETNDGWSRTEAIRKSQHFERNNAIANRLGDVFEIYTVGAGGMPIIPASGDENWNQKRKELWNRWCQNPDLSSLQSFGTQQGLIARRWFFDGAVYVHLTSSDRPPYRPRIRIFEAYRLQTPNDMADRADIYDGIQVDGKGRPVNYFFRVTENGQEISKKIAAEDIVPVAEQTRPGELRPMPFTAPILNDLQDLDELCKLAKIKAKENARITNVFNTENGEMPNSEDIRRNRFQEQDQTATGTGYTEERLKEFELITGSKSIALKANEKLDQIGGKSPNQIEQAHWDIIVNRICAGVGISKLLVFPNSMQGTVVRADLDIANTFFRARSSVLQEAFLRIYRYVTKEEAWYEYSIADKPSDWESARIRSPRAVNVDVGRNTSAILAMLEAGATTYHAIYGELGEEAFEQLEIKAQEEARIDALAKKYVIPPDRIRRSISESLKTQLAAEAQAQQEEDAQSPERQLQKEAA